MASLCHPWFATTNLSYRFPIFETSATALCGTTGIISYHIIISYYIRIGVSVNWCKLYLSTYSSNWRGCCTSLLVSESQDMPSQPGPKLSQTMLLCLSLSKYLTKILNQILKQILSNMLGFFLSNQESMAIELIIHTTHYHLLSLSDSITYFSQHFNIINSHSLENLSARRFGEPLCISFSAGGSTVAFISLQWSLTIWPSLTLNFENTARKTKWRFPKLVVLNHSF